MSNWEWIWTEVMGEVALIKATPILFSASVVTLTSLIGFVLYQSLVFQFRQRLEKKGNEINRLGNEILMLKLRLGNLSENAKRISSAGLRR